MIAVPPRQVVTPGAFEQRGTFIAKMTEAHIGALRAVMARVQDHIRPRALRAQAQPDREGHRSRIDLTGCAQRQYALPSSS